MNRNMQNEDHPRKDGPVDGELLSARPESRESLPAPDPIRLVTSACFTAESVSVPPGVAVRDLHGFAEGEAEELSIFPIETTAWGYLGTGPILIYVALREQVNAGNESEETGHYAVLPGFSSLQGRTWRKTTWVTLSEPECVTLLRFAARATAPDYVRSRYGIRLDERQDAVWGLREELLATAPCAPDDQIEEGLVRCGTPSIGRRGFVRFPLERQRQPGAAWQRYGTGRLGPEPVLLAADVRERQFLSEERGRRRATRRLRGFFWAASLGLLLLATFQYRCYRLSCEASGLAAKVAAQRPAVKALQEQEALTRSVARMSKPPLEPFDWLMAVNEPRPELLAFYTAFFDREGIFGFTGEAPSVSVVNQYREALEKTGRYAKVEIQEISSAKQGVRFTVQVRVDANGRKVAAAEEAR